MHNYHLEMLTENVSKPSRTLRGKGIENKIKWESAEQNRKRKKKKEIPYAIHSLKLIVFFIFFHRLIIIITINKLIAVKIMIGNSIILCVWFVIPILNAKTVTFCFTKLFIMCLLIYALLSFRFVIFFSSFFFQKINSFVFARFLWSNTHKFVFLSS